MRQLLLHIGHGKTGTSYLQNTFRQNSHRLLNEYGIHYPVSNPESERSVGSIGVGNAERLLISSRELANGLAQSNGESKTLLYSSEFMFYWLNEHRDARFISKVAKSADFDRIRVLLFIRNPLSHASTEWQQMVKIGVTASSIESQYQSFDYPEQVDTVLDVLQSEADLDVNVVNYSKFSKALLDVATSWMEVPSQALAPLPVTTVNRGLTKGELAFLLKLNSAVGRNKGYVVNALCERLPDQKPDQIRPSHEVQLATLERLQPAMERVNAKISPDQHYEPDIEASNPICDPLNLSSEQVDILAESVGIRIAKLHNALDAMRQDPGNHVPLRNLLSGLAKRLRRTLRV